MDGENQREQEVEATGDAIVIADAILAGFGILAEAIDRHAQAVKEAAQMDLGDTPETAMSGKGRIIR